MKGELWKKKLKGEGALVGGEGEMAVIKSLALVGNVGEMSIIKSPTVRSSLLYQLSTNKILIESDELLRWCTYKML